MGAHKKIPTNASQNQTNKPSPVQKSKVRQKSSESKESGMMNEPLDSRQPLSRSDEDLDQRHS